jgi:outer membrane protein assembly factor BamE
MRTTVFSRFFPSSLGPLAARSRVAPLSSALLAALALGGCSSFNEPASVKGFLAWIAPYKPDIVQGNVVTSEQMSQIKPGMPRSQVRDILGSPLITDPFHAQRWDYVFTLKRQGFDDLRRAFVVIFDKDAVEKIDAPELPSEDQFVSSISRKKLPDSSPKLVLTDAERAALPAPKAVASAASATVLAGATRTYPPLETAAP